MTRETIEVTRQDRIYCLKVSSGYYLEVCEECKFYPNCDQMTRDDIIELTIKDLEALEQEPCEDVISRQVVLDLLEDTNNGWIINEVSQLLSVNPQSKTGHWVKTPKAVMGEGYMWYCDKCEHQVYQDSSRDYPSEKYCPNCGAKMVEE